MKIGAYVSTHGAAAVAKHFSKELGHVVNESTVKSSEKGGSGWSERQALNNCRILW